MDMNTPPEWWQKTTIYQVYPRSFKDSNGDGIGDLKGLISKLDYIQDLGFETIWLSPIFDSPQQDIGYDVRDYLSIAPEYGDLEDVEQLIEQVHRRGMRILFDLVLNHTSDQHPWFVESRSSRDNPKRSWYIWKEGRGEKPPNNWRSVLGGSGWHFDPVTSQWYYASFLPFQPDLNFRNPEVEQAMLGVTRHWLDMGVDGYRLDIFHSLFKDGQFRDNPRSTTLFSRRQQEGYFQEWRYNLNQPETFQFARKLRQLADSYPTPKLLLGEVFAPDEMLKSYLGLQGEGLNLVFMWDLMDLRAEAGFLRAVIGKFERLYGFPYNPVIVFGNHDQPRLLTKIGGDRRLAALLAVIQFTTRGVPVTYYGEEIGMQQLNLPKNQWLDPVGKRFSWVPGIVLRALRINPARDGCRSPMQWEPAANAGFSTPESRPWLPANQDYAQVNVASQLKSPGSLLNIYRQLLRMRQDYPPLNQGSLEVMPPAQVSGQILAYRRRFDLQVIQVALNFGGSSGVQPVDPACEKELFRLGEFTWVGKEEINLGPHSALILSN